MNGELKDRFAEMLKNAREEAGISQDGMAKALCVSKKTIQNYESGYSSPPQELVFEWLETCNAEPLHYYLNALFPHEFERITLSRDDKDIEDALIKYIKAMRTDDKRKLLFVIYGEHGSTFAELIEMLVAHFHTPEENRITVAQNICTNFEIAEATGRLIAKNHVMPDIKILKNAIIKKRNRILGTEDKLK